MQRYMLLLFIVCYSFSLSCDVNNFISVILFVSRVRYICLHMSFFSLPFVFVINVFCVNCNINGNYC